MLMCSLFILLILLKFVLNYSHLLVSLLCLEYVSLLLYYLLFSFFDSVSNEIFFCLYFLVMVVCEGVLGLCLLVSVSHVSDSSNLKSMNSVVC